MQPSLLTFGATCGSIGLSWKTLIGKRLFFCLHTAASSVQKPHYYRMVERRESFARVFQDR